ncbi:hypothetical protein CTAYLR_005123 [Chrysophaeum taylorii]|uniref:Uncharacterized protein n=1 Tax=Chrysophaeum taylorii TaxID=2483200 RepID=A0AAD7XKX2_9STRA|nr:hypothetical protein CTAYLR_005123 [Chrysophaeum taylorii]
MKDAVNAQAAAFVESRELEDKLAVLRGLSELSDLMDFQRSVELLSGTADDLALIGSYRDFARNDDPRLRRTDSEIYWHRNTGENDFECGRVVMDHQRCEAADDAEYWDEVTSANNPDGYAAGGEDQIPASAPPLEPPPREPGSSSYWDELADSANTAAAA